MTAFKRIVFCLLFIGSFSFLFVKVDAGHSQWNVLGPMVIMWLLSSLAVPGWHVPILARVFALPVVVLVLKGIFEEAALIYVGQASISTWDDLWNWISAVFKLGVFTTVLIKGRMPQCVVNPFGLAQSSKL